MLILPRLRNLVLDSNDPRKREVEAAVFYDLASGVRLSFLQYTIGYVDQPYSLYTGT